MTSVGHLNLIHSSEARETSLRALCGHFRSRLLFDASRKITASHDAWVLNLTISFFQEPQWLLLHVLNDGGNKSSGASNHLIRSSSVSSRVWKTFWARRREGWQALLGFAVILNVSFGYRSQGSDPIGKPCHSAQEDSLRHVTLSSHLPHSNVWKVSISSTNPQSKMGEQHTLFDPPLCSNIVVVGVFIL